jgi:hypothetical protein
MQFDESGCGPSFGVRYFPVAPVGTQQKPVVVIPLVDLPADLRVSILRMGDLAVVQFDGVNRGPAILDGSESDRAIPYHFPAVAVLNLVDGLPGLRVRDRFPCGSVPVDDFDHIAGLRFRAFTVAQRCHTAAI